MKEKVTALFFSPPMFSDGAIARGKLINDNTQNKDMPRGIHSIATYLWSRGISAKVVVIDAFFDGLVLPSQELLGKTEKLIREKIAQYDPDFIGFSMMYGFTERAVTAMARFAKGCFPRKKVIVGGNHATFVAGRLLNNGCQTGIDIVVQGEGERSVYELITGRNLDLIDGISYRSERQAINNKPRLLSGIGDLPPNDFTLIDLPPSVGIENFNHNLQYARGCSFNCSFCTNKGMWGAKVRPHNVESFRKEVEEVLKFHERLPGRPITLLFDDDLPANKEHWKVAFAVLKDAIQDFPKAQFAAQVRVSSTCKDDPQTHEMLEEVKKANFNSLFMGIESGSQVILNAMKKRCNVSWIKDACKNIRRHGLGVGGFWMFGHPGATVEEEAKSLNFLEELLSEKLLDEVEPHITIPFPGSAMRSDPRLEMLFGPDEEVESYSVLEDYPIHQLKDPDSGRIIMTPEEISAVYKKAMAVKAKYLGRKQAIAQAV